jgi:hypothetical protein
LPITKPAIAAAVPVSALRRLMTTGMSAPPIGRTIVTPKTNPAATIRARTTSVTVELNANVPAAPRIRTTVPTIATRATAIVRIWPPGTTIGLPGIRPWSLPPAISEPVNVTEPKTAPRTTKTVVERSAPPPPASRTKSSIATRAAAPPPTALNSETSWGIAVIFTVRAVYKPAPPPSRKPTTMITRAIVLSPSGRTIRSTSVAPTAMTMPEALSRLPLRPVAGEFMRCSPSTKQAAPISHAK